VHKLQAGIIPYIRSNLYVCTGKVLSKLHLGYSSDLLIPDTGYPMSLLKCLASSWKIWYSCYTSLRCRQRILDVLTSWQKPDFLQPTFILFSMH